MIKGSRLAARRAALLLTTSVASTCLLLLGCNGPETITSQPDDPQAEALNHQAPVPPPPMIRASRTYRCKDNSLVYVDFYTDQTARLTLKKDGPAITLTAPAAAGPFTGQGWTLSGSDRNVTLSGPGHGEQGCKA